MPLHHYLPATFIARFSADTRKVPARDKRVIVGDKRLQKCFQSPAEKVGCINNLYTLADDSDSPEHVEQLWEGYERNLPVAIDSLINRSVDAETWTRVLVPFVACMLVRSPDFEERFKNRFPQLITEKLGHMFTPDHANRARIRELSFLLTGALSAKWLVLRAHGKEKIITNDLGYAPFINHLTGDYGLAIPLNFKTVLAIVPTKDNRSILHDRDNKWVPDIEYLDLPPRNQEGLNQSIAVVALRFIFGPDIPTVQKYVRGVPESFTAPEPRELGFPDEVLSNAFEFTWFRLVGAIRKPPSELEGWDFALDWDAITDGWHPTPFVPLNLVQFPPALQRIDNTIQLNFYDPQYYFDISAILFLIEHGDFDNALKAVNESLSHDHPLPLRVDLLVRRAKLHAIMGNFAQARADRESAIAQVPSEDIRTKILNMQELRFPFLLRFIFFLSKITSFFRKS